MTFPEGALRLFYRSHRPSLPVQTFYIGAPAFAWNEQPDRTRAPPRREESAS